MTHTFVLGSLESLWHYGRLPSYNSLQNMMSSSNFTIASQGAGSLRSLFAVLDEDGDGRLSLHEMRSCLAKLGIISSAGSSSQPNADFVPAGLFEWTPSSNPSHQHTSISTHDLLSLDFPQFLQLYSSLFGASQDCPSHDSSCAHEGQDNYGDFDDELLATFRVYDTNHDGFISAAELAAVLIKLGLLPPDCSNIAAHSSTCQAFIESVDLDGNGMVDFEEFKSMMMHSHAPIQATPYTSS